MQNFQDLTPEEQTEYILREGGMLDDFQKSEVGKYIYDLITTGKITSAIDAFTQKHKDGTYKYQTLADFERVRGKIEGLDDVLNFIDSRLALYERTLKEVEEKEKKKKEEK